MSKSDERVLLGRIIDAHGIRGEVAVQSFTAVAEDIAGYGALTDEAGTRRFVLKPRHATSKTLVCGVEGVSDRNAAEALKGVNLYVARERLPPAERGSYYHNDLVGLAVVDQSGTAIGVVEAVLNFGAGDLLELKLDGQRGTEVVPFTDAYVPEVDLAGRKVVVVLPPGTDDGDAAEQRDG